MVTRVVSVHERGEYAEGLPWQIEENHGVHASYPTPDHCTHVQRSPTGELALPLGIVARNEGGYNSTVVCAACALEAVLRALPTDDDRRAAFASVCCVHCGALHPEGRIIPCYCTRDD